MFYDMALLVDEQGEMIDRIEHNVENAAIHVESGRKEIRVAVQYQRKNRRVSVMNVIQHIHPSNGHDVYIIICGSVKTGYCSRESIYYHKHVPADNYLVECFVGGGVGGYDKLFFNFVIFLWSTLICRKKYNIG